MPFGVSWTALGQVAQKEDSQSQSVSESLNDFIKFMISVDFLINRSLNAVLSLSEPIKSFMNWF